MLSNDEIEGLAITLLDLRRKLLWLISQEPINNKQRECIEEGKGNLIKVNQFLRDFNIKLPN